MTDPRYAKIYNPPADQTTGNGVIDPRYKQIYDPGATTTPGGGVGGFLSDAWGDVKAVATDPVGAMATLNRGIGLGFVDPGAAISAAGDWSGEQLGMQPSLPGKSYVEKYNAAVDQNDQTRARFAQEAGLAAPFVQGTGGLVGGEGLGQVTRAATEFASPAIKTASRYVPAVATGAHEGWVNTPDDAPVGQKLANAIAGATTGLTTQFLADLGVGTVARVATPTGRPAMANPPPVIKPLLKGAAKTGAGAALTAIAAHTGVLGDVGEQVGLLRSLESGAHDMLKGAGAGITRLGDWWTRTQPTGPAVRVGGRFARGEPTYNRAAAAAGPAITQQATTAGWNPIAANSPLANTLAYWMPDWSD